MIRRFLQFLHRLHFKLAPNHRNNRGARKTPDYHEDKYNASRRQKDSP